ncbi:MAG: hypothetical protein EXR77_03985 [Myxococcales bacterium]|nr:hypothetical protein [Myxococcales bacterium]
MGHRVAVATLALVWAFAVGVPAVASASCIEASACLCPFSPIVAAVQAEIVTIDASGVAVRIDAIDLFGTATTTLAVGATATAAVADLGAKVVVGDRVVGTVGPSGTVVATVRIDSDQRVTCRYAPTFRPMASSARIAMAKADCPKQLGDLGLVPPPCNDTEARAIDGCATRHHCGSPRQWWPALVVVLLCGWRRRWYG